MTNPPDDAMIEGQTKSSQLYEAKKDAQYMRDLFHKEVDGV